MNIYEKQETLFNSLYYELLCSTEEDTLSFQDIIESCRVKLYFGRKNLWVITIVFWVLFLKEERVFEITTFDENIFERKFYLKTKYRANKKLLWEALNS